MVTMATAAYGVQHTMAASTTVVVGQNAHQPANEEQYISTFFCRALYDYQTTDASSLSFHKNDIIEVLTRLESGWWDGLLGDERGWFPSNYVAVISDQEAEATLNGSEFSVSQPSSLADDSTVDMARSMSQALSQSDHDGDWLHDDTDLLNRTYHTNGHAQGSNGHATQHNDFWVPQVSQDGRVSTASPVLRGWVTESVRVAFADILCEHTDRAALSRPPSGGRGGLRCGPGRAGDISHLARWAKRGDGAGST